MGISVWQLLIILAIVLLLFGAKRLRNIGGDLGATVKGFKKAMNEGEGDDSKQLNEKAEGEAKADAGQSSSDKDKA